MEFKFPAGLCAAIFTSLVSCLEGHAVSPASPLMTSLNACQGHLMTLPTASPEQPLCDPSNSLVATVETELRSIRDDDHDVVNPLWRGLSGRRPRVGTTRGAVQFPARRPLAPAWPDAPTFDPS
jgi:hypothetical protein